jgi:hypothetical protein
MSRTSSVSIVPCLTGAFLWAGASSLLLEDAWRTTATFLTPTWNVRQIVHSRYPHFLWLGRWFPQLGDVRLDVRLELLHTGSWQ